MAHHKIAFLADTHGLLREEVVQKIKDCEVIFHAGDFGGPEIVERLQQIAPVYTARGNNDKEWAKDMPYFVREQIGNRTFYMCHKKQDLPDDLGEVDFVICGHSHKYELKQEGSICYINPGSCGPRRFHQPITFAILYFEDEAADYRIEKIDLSPALTKENAKKLSLSEKDLDRLIGSHQAVYEYERQRYHPCQGGERTCGGCLQNVRDASGRHNSRDYGKAGAQKTVCELDRNSI